MTTLINLAKQRATELDREQKPVKLDYNANIYQGDIVSYYNALNHGKIQQHANSVPIIDNHKRTYNSEYLQLQYQPNSGKTDLMRKQLLEGRMSQISGQYNIPTAQEPNLSLGSNSPIVNELDKILNNFVEKVSSGIFDVTMTSDLYAILKIIENEGYKFGRDLLERYKSFFEDIIDLLDDDTTTDFIEGIKNEKSVSQLMSNVTGRCIDIIDAMLDAVKKGNSSTERKLILDAYIKNNILKQTKEDKLKFMKQINKDLKRKEDELKKAKKEKNDRVVALLEEQIKLLKEIKFNGLDAFDKFKSTMPTQNLLLEDGPYTEGEPVAPPNYDEMFARDEQAAIELRRREEAENDAMLDEEREQRATKQLKKSIEETKKTTEKISNSRRRKDAKQKRNRIAALQTEMQTQDEKQVQAFINYSRKHDVPYAQLENDFVFFYNFKRKKPSEVTEDDIARDKAMMTNKLLVGFFDSVESYVNEKNAIAEQIRALEQPTTIEEPEEPVIDAIPFSLGERTFDTEPKEKLNEIYDYLEHQIEELEELIVQNNANIRRKKNQRNALSKNGKKTLDGEIKALEEKNTAIQFDILKLTGEKKAVRIEMSKRLSNPDDVGRVAVDLVDKTAADLKREMEHDEIMAELGDAVGGIQEGKDEDIKYTPEETATAVEVADVLLPPRIKAVTVQGESSVVYFNGISYKKRRGPFIKETTKEQALSLLSFIGVPDPAKSNKALGGTSSTSEWLGYIYDNILAKDRRLRNQQNNQYFQ